MIPCGKCAECMKKKQDSIRIRCYNEAKNKGSMHFLTLTYKDETLPFSRVLLSASMDTGEISISSDVEILDRKLIPHEVIDRIFSDKESIYRAKMRFCDVPELLRDGNAYFYRYIPCHDYGAVKRLLKLARKWYMLQYSNPLDFSYIIVPEFGERYSRRPHFHCCLFGCPDDFVEFISRAWSEGLFRLSAKAKRLINNRMPFFASEHWLFGDELGDVLKFYPDIKYFEVFKAVGFTDTKKVNAVNEDGSDGFGKCASYIGKYVGKGVFEDVQIRDGFLVLPRVSCSKFFGVLPQSLIDWHLARDVFGDYDDETLKGLSDNAVQKLVELVSRRLIYFYPNAEKPITLPGYFRKSIFKARVAFSRREVPSHLAKAAYSFADWPSCGKIIYSALYYKVQDFIRDSYLQRAEKEFETFIFNNNTIPLCEAVALFESIKQSALKNREAIALRRQKHSLTQSKL